MRRGRATVGPRRDGWSARAARLLVGLGLSTLGATGPARADAPPGRYTIPAPGTVRDTKTGLVWQEMPGASHDYPGAASYCKNLVLEGGGWWVPSLKELCTIIDVRQSFPAIDRTFFPNTPANIPFWTSTLKAGDPSRGFQIYSHVGNTNLARVTDQGPVRCVR